MIKFNNYIGICDSKIDYTKPENRKKYEKSINQIKNVIKTDAFIEYVQRSKDAKNNAKKTLQMFDVLTLFAWGQIDGYFIIDWKKVLRTNPDKTFKAFLELHKSLLKLNLAWYRQLLKDCNITSLNVCKSTNLEAQM